MHDGMQYDPIQGQGHEPLKFGHFQRLSPPPIIMGLANDHGFLNLGQYLKLIGAGFRIFVPVFVSCDFDFEVSSK